VPFVIGVAGGTGSGKTTVAKKINESLRNEESVIIIEQDSYYRCLAHVPRTERKSINFDHPDSIDFDLLSHHVRRLLDNESIKKPVYDFVQHVRKNDTEYIEPADIIIIEGILVFHNRELRALMDLKLFVDTDADIRVFRRIKRDIEDRGRSFESVRQQYYETVRPMHTRYVEPCKHWADIVIPEGGKNVVAIDMIVARIRQWLLDASK